MKNNNPNHILLGAAAAISVVFFWSGWIVVSRLGVTNTLTVYDITGLRFAVGASVALPYIIWRRTWRGLTPLQVLVLTLTSGIPYALLSYFGFSYAPAAHGGVFLNGCLPLFTTLFGWIWVGQRSRVSQLVGLGVIISFRGACRGRPDGHSDPAGDAGPAGLDRHGHSHSRHSASLRVHQKISS